MINLISIKNQKFNDIKLIRILFYTFPLSFILGNLILSAHLLIFLLVSFWIITKRGLIIRFNKILWILVLLILVLFISTSIQAENNWNFFLEFSNTNPKKIPLENNPIFKSFILVRFVLLIFFIDVLFFNKVLNLKYFFLSALICTSIVSLDIIIQFVFGYDLFGYERIGRYNPGPFGDELIAGGYLQRFSFFSFFFLFIFLKEKKFSKILLIFTIALHGTAILLAGNRIPIILYMLGCFSIFFFVKNFRLSMFLSILLFVITFFTIVNIDQKLKSSYFGFFQNFVNYDYYIEKTTVKTLEDGTKIERKEKQAVSNYSDLKNKVLNLSSSGHIGIYRTSLELWKQQPIFGSGLKSFRFKCWKILSRGEEEMYHCANHPHNYYLELLVEVGIFGFLLMIIFFIILLKKSFIYIKKNYKKNALDLYLFIPVLLTFLLEIWPIKSTGSFFTTSNATFIFIIISLMVATLYNHDSH